MKEKVVIAIGRWMPIHLGHKKFLVELAKQYDKLIIGIGSCYENGTARNCIPAVKREKLLNKVFEAEKISKEKIKIIHIADREKFEYWANDVLKICKENKVTHFCTGNKKDILDILEEKGIDLNLIMLNPEEESNFPYHATDIRDAIINGEENKLSKMLPTEIKDIVIKNISKDIIDATKGEGKEFVTGKQYVNTIFLVKNQEDSKTYILLKKSEKMQNIPSLEIKKFESPIDEATRCLGATGIKLKITDNTDEPAKIMLPQLSSDEQTMYYMGIYDLSNAKGELLGNSQVFCISIKGNIAQIQKMLKDSNEFFDLNDLKNMKLSQEQKQMIYDAVYY